MMAKTDNTAAEGSSLASTVANGLLVIALGLFSIFSLGVFAGLLTVTLQEGTASWKALAIMLLAVVLALASGAFAYRRVRGSLTAPLGPRARQSRNLFIAAMVIGVVIGILMSIENPGDAGSMFSNAPMAGWIAIVLAAFAIGVIPGITLLWWRALDEHEAQAYSDGALIALNANVTITASWWVLWRGGFVSAVQPMTIFLITLCLWSAVWAWKRYV